jgi:hypothetical protein
MSAKRKETLVPLIADQTAPRRLSLNGNGNNFPTAHVDIEISRADFVDIVSTQNGPGDPRLTSAKWTLRAAIDGVIQQGEPNQHLIVLGPVNIDFHLPPGSPFRLAGIAFRRVRGGGAANGHGNLPKENIRITEDEDGSSTIHVTNTWTNHGPANTWNWDFFIMVQDEGGDLGIIDPDIENQDGT